VDCDTTGADRREVALWVFEPRTSQSRSKVENHLPQVTRFAVINVLCDDGWGGPFIELRLNYPWRAR
jgi:hypothetical protein